MNIIINKEECIKCETCVLTCCNNLITKDPEGIIINSEDLYCEGCLECVKSCPVGALVVEEEL